MPLGLLAPCQGPHVLRQSRGPGRCFTNGVPCKQTHLYLHLHGLTGAGFRYTEGYFHSLVCTVVPDSQWADGCGQEWGGQPVHLAEAEGCQTSRTGTARKRIPKTSVTRPREASKRLLCGSWLLPLCAFPEHDKSLVAFCALAADESTSAQKGPS